MIYGTLMVSGIAFLFAIPFAFGAALFTAEYLPARPRLWVKCLIELLASMPSVVYGLIGVLLLRDWVYWLFQSWGIVTEDTLLTAGVLLAIMILPTIMSLSDDALRGFLSGNALGMRRSEVIFRVVLPQARRGLIAAIVLALGRALGETIAVFMVVGRQDNQWPESLLSLAPLLRPGQTLTSKLGSSETNLAYGDTLHWRAIVGLSLILLIITAICSIVAGIFQKGCSHE